MRSALTTTAQDVLGALRLFGWRGWAIAILGAAAALLLLGAPTDIVPNQWFTRMTPVRSQDYAIWLATGALFGLVLGTYVVPARACAQGRTLSGGILSFLAIGCPICNKLVVALLGISGALTYFEPAQLWLGLLSLALLLWSLALRARTLAASTQGAAPTMAPQQSPQAFR
jgi:hypothetical protein